MINTLQSSEFLERYKREQHGYSQAKEPWAFLLMYWLRGKILDMLCVLVFIFLVEWISIGCHLIWLVK